jgi:hypothetical protein
MGIRQIPNFKYQIATRSPVAQISNLLYRRLPVCQRSEHIPLLTPGLPPASFSSLTFCETTISAPNDKKPQTLAFFLKKP